MMEPWISGTYHIIHSIAYIYKVRYYIINEIAWYKPNAAPNMDVDVYCKS